PDGFVERNALFQRSEELARLEHRVVHDLADVAPRDGHRERFWLQSRAMTRRAWPRRHVLLQVLADEIAVGLFETPLDVRDDALVMRAVFATAPALALVRHHDPLAARPVQDLLDVLGLEI